MALNQSLHLLDSHDRVAAREAERARQLAELDQLTRTQAIPSTPARQAAAVDLAQSRSLTPRPGMWDRPATPEVWAAAKQAADRKVARAKRSRAFQGWWIMLILWAISASGVFHAFHSVWVAATVGLMLAVVPGLVVFMLIYSFLYTPSTQEKYDTPRRKATAERLAAAEAERANLEPEELTPEEARRLTEVPGLGPLLAQAHAGDVPLLGLDLAEARKRERAHKEALAAEHRRNYERKAPARARAALAQRQAKEREVEAILAAAARRG